MMAAKEQDLSQNFLTVVCDWLGFFEKLLLPNPPSMVEREH
jgi:hypothetical protein